MKRIAYLAPELPALSATFVYNEILSLEKNGFLITPVSVHHPTDIAQEKRIANLKNRTIKLYPKGVRNFLLATFSQFCTSPTRFLRTLVLLLHDMGKVGVFSRTAAGLCFRFTAACLLARILREQYCEHMHIHFAHIPTDIGMYASSLTHIPFSFTAHANDIFERGWLLREKVARAKFAVTISEYNRNWLITRGCEGDKIHIVRCGIDSSRFSTVPLKVPNFPYHIGTIGRMVEKKGFDTLLRATKILADKGIDLRVSIVGGGPQEEQLKNLADELRLHQLITFRGPMRNQDVPSWLQTLDLFVLPCQQDSDGDMDGIPVVLMEAMLSGIPVISTNISGIPELVVNEVSGLLVRPRAPEELAIAIERLLTDCKLRNTTYRNGIQRVLDEFEQGLNTERLLRLIVS